LTDKSSYGVGWRWAKRNPTLITVSIGCADANPSYGRARFSGVLSVNQATF